MYNCHMHVAAFHDERVRFTDEMKSEMRRRRNANQERLQRGLTKANKPLPLRHVKQGSYAMHTMVQSEINASDIDDGAVFAKKDLVGPRGGEFTPSDAKSMVRDALDDGSFARPPAVRTNCVRVYYGDGVTVDIPVYRQVTNGDATHYELASTEWKKSDPEAVTEWFNKAVVDKSPDITNGRQMRRVVKLLKAWSKSRESWNMPSGFILSALTDEKYWKDARLLDRDDEAFLSVLERIRDRVRTNRVVAHPVLPYESITKTSSDACMAELADRAETAADTLSVLRNDDCTELTALKALKSVFNTDFFDERIADLEKPAQKAEAAPYISFGAAPEAPAIKRGGDQRYA